jgi:hypothetical protein
LRLVRRFRVVLVMVRWRASSSLAVMSKGRSPHAVAMQGRPQQLNLLLYLGASPHGALELLNAFAYIWQRSKDQATG